MNPHGCVVSGWRSPFTVVNYTDKSAAIYDGPDCRGHIINVVPANGGKGGAQVALSIGMLE